MRKRSLHNRLWRIRLAYRAGQASVESFGGVPGYGWGEDKPAWCNVWVSLINTPDLRSIDERMPKRVKVGRGSTVEAALKDAESRLGDAEAILERLVAEHLGGRDA